MATEEILGYSVYSGSLEGIIEDVVENIKNPSSEKKTKVFFCINPHSYAIARGDIAFRGALQDSTWLVPDGVGIVMASRILGGAISKRLTGPDFFLKTNSKLSSERIGRVFFLGSNPGTLRKIKNKFMNDFPNVEFVGSYSPPFKSSFDSEDTRLMLEQVRLAKPDVLWVGMTAPKQEKWINENKEKLQVSVVAAVGAVFDFYAGNIKRPSLFFQRFGLEWLPRLIREPVRLWPRMFISAPVFLFFLFKYLINKKAKTKK